MPTIDTTTNVLCRKQLRVILTKNALNMMVFSIDPRSLQRAICYCDLNSGEVNSMADVTMRSTPDI
jgi:hypothetical protein